jgi:hypothetical protein
MAASSIELDTVRFRSAAELQLDNPFNTSQDAIIQIRIIR